MVPSKSNLVRIRDNQRKSRAQRKAYVRELEQRVRLYEHQGVEATLEIQHAARKVVKENQELRVFLNNLGFDSRNIDNRIGVGSLNPAGNTPSNPQGGMVQTPELPPAPYQAQCPDSAPHAATSTPIYGGIETHIAVPPEHDLVGLDELAANMSEYMNISDLYNTARLQYGIAYNGIGRNTEHPTSNSLAERSPIHPLEYVEGLLQPQGELQSMHTIQSGQGSSRQGAVEHGEQTNPQPLFEADHGVDLCSDLSPMSGESDFYSSTETLFPNALYQNDGQDCFSVEDHYYHDYDGNGGFLAFSPEML